ncbi:MAG: hypothetical protein ACI4TB_02375 [Lachnospiraceae bacterium]
MEEEYSKLQLEDKALKSASMYFGQELLPYLGIGKKILRMVPTEQIRLEAVRTLEDILFLMEDNTLAHFEFESVEVNLDDLRRFRTYDAYTGLTYKVPVITYVICSGKVSRIRSELCEAGNRYHIIPLQMKQEDADVLFAELRSKAANGNVLTKKDLAPLLLTPLMNGKSSIRDRILGAKEILDAEGTQLQTEEKQHMEAVLYAFACKFLEKADLNAIKEVLGMTVLGEMIWNDGLEAGKGEGKREGKSLNLITLICRKIKKGKSPEQIAEDLDEELPVVERICEVAKQCAPDYDCEEIYCLLQTKSSDT